MGIEKKEHINNLNRSELINMVASQREFIHEQDDRLLRVQNAKDHETSRANTNLEDYDRMEKRRTKLKAKYKRLRRKYKRQQRDYIDTLEMVVKRCSNE